ncbi:hypothetical protein [Desertibacillus haloalkaliphilus]|uniref:hypothetical protein n=1 Tax=Desertibacillus haloalkaliphilus TaxID=1328930 RepID=UPI001C268000|nr:hypothetical protein [Desertibacillus haloalkaliphilus]MBU8905057.1 hypothetical protein [Desertibacillus haloalkaliphilus]
MKVIKNNDGSTLLVTLLTITIFTVIGLSVITGTINNAKQVNTTEASIQATHLAEMGVDYYEKEITAFVEKETRNEVQRLKERYEQDLEDYNNEQSVNKPVEPDYAMESFEYLKTEFDHFKKSLLKSSPVEVSTSPDSKAIFTIENVSNIENDIMEKFTIGFDSVGTVGSNNIQILRSTIEFSFLHSLDSPPNSQGSFNLDPCLEGQTNFKESNKCQFNNDTVFNNNISINGQGKLKINGDAKFKKDLELNGNPASLCVRGQLSVDGNISDSGNSVTSIYVLSTEGEFNLSNLNFEVIINKSNNKYDGSASGQSIVINVVDETTFNKECSFTVDKDTPEELPTNERTYWDNTNRDVNY